MAELKDLEVEFSIEVTDLLLSVTMRKNNFADDIVVLIDDGNLPNSTTVDDIRAEPNNKYTTVLLNWDVGSLGDVDWNFQLTFSNNASDEQLVYYTTLYVPETGRTGFVSKISGSAKKAV